MNFNLKEWLGVTVSKLVSSIGDAIDKNVTNKGEKIILKNETSKLLLDYQLESQTELTKRLDIDMSSDNKLSKNIRPLSLIYTTFIVSALAFFDGNIGRFTITEGYINLFQSLLIMQYAFYFGSRGIEKIMQQVYKAKQ